MKEGSDRESEPVKWAKMDSHQFWIQFWAVEFLLKFQPDPMDGSKFTSIFVKCAHDHIVSPYDSH